MAHGHDLRSEIDDKRRVPRLVSEWRNAPLSGRERAICDFAEALTRAPGHVRERDLAPLRAAGLDDAGITDVVQVVGYFNYINRVADGLGIDPEPDLPRNPDQMRP
jgi:uncharacterized peroxidase-related enzyme